MTKDELNELAKSLDDSKIRRGRKSRYKYDKYIPYAQTIVDRGGTVKRAVEILIEKGEFKEGEFRAVLIGICRRLAKAKAKEGKAA